MERKRKEEEWKDKNGNKDEKKREEKEGCRGQKDGVEDGEGEK